MISLQEVVCPNNYKTTPQQSFPFCQVMNLVCILSLKPLQQPKELGSLLQVRKPKPRKVTDLTEVPSYKERNLNWNSDLWNPELKAVCFQSNLPLHFKALLSQDKKQL